VVVVAPYHEAAEEELGKEPPQLSIFFSLLFSLAMLLHLFFSSLSFSFVDLPGCFSFIH